MDFRSLSMQLGFRIPIVSGILDSLSCIPDSKTQDFGFQSLAEFWIPRAVFRIPGKPRILDSTEQKSPGSWNLDSLIWGDRKEQWWLTVNLKLKTNRSVFFSLSFSPSCLLLSKTQGNDTQPYIVHSHKKGFLKREGFKLCLFSYHIQNNAVLVTVAYSPKYWSCSLLRTNWLFIFISYQVRVGLKTC